MSLIRCPECRRIVSTEAPIELHDCTAIVPRVWKKRRKKNQSSKLSERLIKRLIDLGLRFELDSSNYAIVRDDKGIQLGISEGMDYASWCIFDTSYPELVYPMVWAEELDKFIPTAIDGVAPVTKLLARSHILEIHRRYGGCFVD